MRYFKLRVEEAASAELDANQIDATGTDPLLWTYLLSQLHGR